MDDPNADWPVPDPPPPRDRDAIEVNVYRDHDREGRAVLRAGCHIDRGTIIATVDGAVREKRS